MRPDRRATLAGLAASLAPGWAHAKKPLAGIEARTGGRLGVAALDISTGARLVHRPAELFPMCSTFKVMAVAAALERVEDGADRLDRFVRYGPQDLLSYAPVTRPRVGEGGLTLGELCAAAIEVSDNTAANLVLASIGGPEGWTAFVRRLGDPVSRLDRTEPTLNTALPKDPRDTTSPAAMLSDLQEVLLGGGLSSDSRRRLHGWMSRCTTGLDRLRRGLPQSWTVGDKTGSGDNGTSNDIAVAWRPEGPIVITCYLTGARADAAARDAAIADVARVVAAAFTAPRAAAWPS
jgi:beta-lactamase class A